MKPIEGHFYVINPQCTINNYVSATLSKEVMGKKSCFLDKREKQLKLIDSLQLIFEHIDGMHDDCIGDMPNIQVKVTAISKMFFPVTFFSFYTCHAQSDTANMCLRIFSFIFSLSSAIKN